MKCIFSKITIIMESKILILLITYSVLNGQSPKTIQACDRHLI